MKMKEDRFCIIVLQRIVGKYIFCHQLEESEGYVRSKASDTEDESVTGSEGTNERECHMKLDTRATLES